MWQIKWVKRQKIRANMLRVLAWLCFVGAAGLFLWYAWVDARAGRQAQRLLAELQTQTDVAQCTPTPLPEGQQMPSGGILSDGSPDTALPSATLSAQISATAQDGNEYIGTLQIVPLGLSLPILAQASSAGLKLAPCRMMGSSREGNLVVAGHNYQRHFGKLKTLLTGDAITLTDMDGTVHTYTVASVQEVAATAVETVCQSGYPLVLYTCTLGGVRRVVVFCKGQDASGSDDERAQNIGDSITEHGA